MTGPVTAASAEAEVALARAELTATLDQLKDNLRPGQLFDEVMDRPRRTLDLWLDRYGDFAKHSPLSGVIIGAAAVAMIAGLAGLEPSLRKTVRRR